MPCSRCSCHCCFCVHGLLVLLGRTNTAVVSAYPNPSNKPFLEPPSRRTWVNYNIARGCGEVRCHIAEGAAGGVRIECLSAWPGGSR